MTKEEFKKLQSDHVKSGMSLKLYLQQIGTSYSTYNYWLCPGHTDMRKGISSLCGVVHERMKSEVRNGDVFIFIGRDLKLMKLLHAEDGGMVMYVKRLEAGRFKLPDYDEQTRSYRMEWRDLVLMVEGIETSGQCRLGNGLSS